MRLHPGSRVQRTEGKRLLPKKLEEPVIADRLR